MPECVRKDRVSCEAFFFGGDMLPKGSLLNVWFLSRIYLVGRAHLGCAKGM